MTTPFSLSVLASLSHDKVTITHYRKASEIILKCYACGDQEDWLSCRSFLTALAYSDTKRTSASVRREARMMLDRVSRSRDELRREMEFSDTVSNDCIRVLFPRLD